MYKYTKIQGPRFQRNYIIVRDQKREKTWRVISFITENKPHSHHKTYKKNKHTMKVFNTRSVSITIEVLLTKILFFPSTEVFTCLQSNQRFQAIEFVALGTPSQRFLFPVSTVSARNAWDHDPLWCTKYEEKKNWFADSESCCYASETKKIH